MFFITFTHNIKLPICVFLRKKIKFIGSKVSIKAVRGLGYILEEAK